MKQLFFLEPGESLKEGDALLCPKCLSEKVYENEENEIKCEGGCEGSREVTLKLRDCRVAIKEETNEKISKTDIEKHTPNKSTRELKVVNTELTRSKKDDIFCLFIEFNHRCFGVEHENIQDNILELGFGNCENEEIIADIEIALPNPHFEFMSYTITKDKESLYIYFFEYPYEEDELLHITNEIPIDVTMRKQ